jgi:hypothetical protein
MVGLITPAVLLLSFLALRMDILMQKRRKPPRTEDSPIISPDIRTSFAKHCTIKYLH